MIATPMSRAMSSHMATAQSRAGVSGFPPPPVAGSNVILRTLANRGIVDGTRLPDELRTGTRRDLWPGCCTDLNGSNQYLTTTATAGDYTANFCVSGWVYKDTHTNDQVIACKRGGAAQYQLYAQANTGVLAIWDGTNVFASNKSVGLSAWHHIVFDIRNGSAYVWLNGAQSAVLSGLSIADTAELLYIGGFSGGGFFNGKIFDVRVFNRTLTAAQIIGLGNYNENEPHDAVNHWWLNKPYCIRQDDVAGGQHGTIANYALSVHYFGRDVPRQPMNNVGYSQAGTNYLQQWDNLSNAYWTKRGSTTVTAAADYAPDNTLTAWRIDNLRNATPYSDLFNANYTTFHSIPAGLRSLSIWVKRVSTTGVISINEPNLGKNRLTVDLALIGAGWVEINDSKPLPVGVTRASEVASFSVNQGGMIISNATDDTPRSILVWKPQVRFGYLPGRNELNTAQDIDGGTLEMVGECPHEPLLINSNCLTLNGSTQYVIMGTGYWDTDGTEAMEVEFWANISSSGNTRMLVVHRESSGNYRGWQIYYDNVGQINFEICNTLTTNQIQVATKPPGFNDSVWHKYKVTYDGSRSAAGVAVYVDGIRCATQILADNLTGTASAPAAVSCIGARNAVATNLFLGSLADLKVTIGTDVDELSCGEGGTANGVYNRRKQTFHTIANAGSNWGVVQSKVHPNAVNGHRSGRNMFPYSQAYAGSRWAKITTNLTDNTTTAPDGTSTAATLSNNAAAGLDYHYMTWSNGLANGDTLAAGTYTLSAYVKPKLGSGWVWLLGETSADAFCYFNVLTGVTGSGTGWTNQVIAALANGWYRIAAAFTKTSASGNEQVGIGLATANGTPNWNSAGLANTQQVYLWGMQLEAGATLTEYFPTKEVNGLSFVPASSTPLVAANGLTVNRPGGPWQPLAETAIDFTCSQPLAPTWDGQVITEIDDYTMGRSVALLQKVVTSAYERQFQLLEA